MLVHTKVASASFLLRDRASWEGPQGLRGTALPVGGRRLPPLRKHFVLQVARLHTCGHLVLQLCPEPGGTRGARVGNGKAGNDKAALSTRWAAPLRNHAMGFPKPLAQPLRFRISGLGLV